MKIVKKIIVITLALMLYDQSIQAMSEEMKQTLAQIRRDQTAIPSSSLLPGATLSTQQTKIQEAIARQKQIENDAAMVRASEHKPEYLSPGIHTKTIAGFPIQQLALQDNDKQKIGLTCGPRAILIATALDNIVKTTQAITPATMHLVLEEELKHTTIIKQCRQNYETRSDEFEEFMSANQIVLNNLFVLGLQVEKGRASSVIPLATHDLSMENENAAIIELDYLEGIPSELTRLGSRLKAVAPGTNTPEFPIIHFICNTGGHWVLFALVNRDINTHPTLWYIDSMNVDANARPQLKNFVRYITGNLWLQQ